jgi:acyl dehydratase
MGASVGLKCMVEPLAAGYRFAQTLSWDEEEIVAGARFLDDRNPVHNDHAAATASRFGRLIACGPHISGIHACMLPTHCTSRGFGVLGTFFTVRYSAPVFANTPYELHWTVTAATPHKSGGHIMDWVGAVGPSEGGRACIDATGQLLVTSARPDSSITAR